jgi:hypothetical protein
LNFSFRKGPIPPRWRASRRCAESFLRTGRVFLARSESQDEDRNWVKLYRAAGNLPSLFDRCLTVPASEIPHAFEVLIKPGAWAAVLIHSPDVNSSYPFPFGYITADPSIVEPYKHLIAELAAKADGTRAVLWAKSGEDAHRALASIDTALG